MSRKTYTSVGAFKADFKITSQPPQSIVSNRIFRRGKHLESMVSSHAKIVVNRISGPIMFGFTLSNAMTH